jgi:hypothetical protein
MVKVINRLDVKDNCYCLSVDITNENGSILHETLTHKLPILELHQKMKLDEETEKLKKIIEDKIKEELFFIIGEEIKEKVQERVNFYCNKEVSKT